MKKNQKKIMIINEYNEDEIVDVNNYFIFKLINIGIII